MCPRLLVQLRTSLAVGSLGLLINFIGCGLEGRYDLSEFNMQLDDGVRGCPAYEQATLSPPALPVATSRAAGYH